MHGIYDPHLGLQFPKVVKSWTHRPADAIEELALVVAGIKAHVDGWHCLEFPDGTFAVYYGSYERGWFGGYQRMPTASLAIYVSDWPLAERRVKGNLVWL